MIATHVSHHALLFAAHSIGVVADIEPKNWVKRVEGPTRFRVKRYPQKAGLYTPSGKRKQKDGRSIPAPFERTSPSGSTRLVNAVCWHGFRAYFRKVFEFHPDAVFRTSLATWRGSDDFEQRHTQTMHHNIGSQFRPMSIADACTCND